MPIHTSTPALTTYKSMHMPLPTSTSTSTPTLTIQNQCSNFANIVHYVQDQQCYDNTQRQESVTLSQWFKGENERNNLHNISRHTRILHAFHIYTHFAYLEHTYTMHSCIQYAYIQGYILMSNIIHFAYIQTSRYHTSYACIMQQTNNTTLDSII